jgi:hypothetical protein
MYFTYVFVTVFAHFDYHYSGGNAYQTSTASPMIVLPPSASPTFDDAAQNRLHLDAINEHLRYIYERLDDVIKRIEKLEKFHQF